MPPSSEHLLTLLRVAKEVSAEVPVPGLSTAIGIALFIVEKAKEINDTQDGCRVLAERAAYFSLGVYDQLKQCDSDHQSIATKEHVTRLLCTLGDIEELMKRRRKMRVLSLLRRNADIAEETSKLSSQLEDAIRLYMIQTGVHVEQTVDFIASTNIRLLQHVDDSARVGDALRGETKNIRNDILDLAQRLSNTATYDGDFRLFARENIDLLEPIEVATSSREVRHTTSGGYYICSAACEQPGRVVRYRATVKAAGELSGTRVVVHAYPHQDDRMFVEAVKLAKQTCNPYVLAVLGYSRPGGSGTASYIVTEDYSPYMEFLNSYHGINKLRVLLQVTSEICSVVNHLEMTDLRQALTPREYNGFWRTQYAFGSSELVFDHRQGGRVKWARKPPTLPPSAHERQPATIPLTQTDRTQLMDELLLAACASSDVVAHCWFSHLVRPTWDVGNLHRTVWAEWQTALEPPWYALGGWVGRDYDDEVWTLISAPTPAVGAITIVDTIPTVLAWGGSSPEMPAVSSYLQPDDPYEHPVVKKLRVSKPLDVPAGDLGEMSVDFALDGARWKRYQFSRLPVGSTMLFQQSVRIQDGSDSISRLVCSSPDMSTATYKGICIDRKYHTESTAIMPTTHAAKQPPSPLWFFLLIQSDCDSSDTHSSTHPHGFWSSEKSPASIPEDVVFDPTPRYEHVEYNYEAPLSTWTQALGDLTFTIQTKMYSYILELNADDEVALSELQLNHTQASTCGMHAYDPEDCATLEAESEAIDPGMLGVLPDEEDEDGESDAAVGENEGGLEPRIGIEESFQEDVEEDETSSEYHDAEESLCGEQNERLR